MDHFEALTAFVAVAEQHSFAGAARSLGVSPPVMTRAIAGLERRYGVALFHRSTRSVTLTEDGAMMLERVRDILRQLRETEHVLIDGRSEPRGELHLTAPVMFGRMHVLPVVAKLLALHPALTVRMMLIDRNVRIVEEGIDVAVRVGHLEDSSLTCVKVGEVRQTIVASHDYCAAKGVPMHPSDLAHHDIIAGDNGRISGHWRFGPKSAISIPVAPRLTVNSLDAVLAAVRAGLGLANVLSYQAHDDIASGALRSVLDEHAPPPVPVQLVFPANRAGTPSVRLFVEAMATRSAAGMWA